VTPPAPVITTEIQRVLYADGDRTVTWLAERLGVTRQQVGQWLRGVEVVPRRRQAQIRVHLEEPSRPLFDGTGRALSLEDYARMTGGAR
jgi:hypothetical protein